MKIEKSVVFRTSDGSTFGSKEEAQQYEIDTKRGKGIDAWLDKYCDVKDEAALANIRQALLDSGASLAEFLVGGKKKGKGRPPKADKAVKPAKVAKEEVEDKPKAKRGRPPKAKEEAPAPKADVADEAPADVPDDGLAAPAQRSYDGVVAIKALIQSRNLPIDYEVKEAEEAGKFLIVLPGGGESDKRKVPGFLKLSRMFGNSNVEVVVE